MKMQTNQFHPKQRWLLPLLLLLCFFGGSSLNIRAAMSFGDYTSVSLNPRWNYPWTEMVLCFYDTNGKDSFFTHDKGDGTHDGPAIYFDNKYICSPNWELAWPGSGSGNDSGLDKERSHNSWWGSEYKANVDGKDYVIKFHDPRLEGGRYYVTLVVYARHLELDVKHSIRIRGWWRTNRDGGKWVQELVNKTWELNAISTPFSGPSSPTVTDYNHFTINGNLHTAATTTWVGSMANANGSGYVAPGQLTEKKDFGAGSPSYSDLLFSIDRTDFYNRTTKNVEYVVKRAMGTVSGNDRGDYYFYKWYTLSIPGFVRAKGLRTDADIWNRKIILTWDADESDSRCKEGTWRVYRQAEGESTWKLMTKTDQLYTQREFTDEDASLVYDKQYTYKVIFIPKNSPSGTERSELSQTVTGKLARPASIFSELTASNDMDDKIVFSWKHVNFENANSKPYTLIVQRSTDDPSKPNQMTWTDLERYTVNSKSTSVGSHEDTRNLESFKGYSYRVVTTVFDRDYQSSMVTGRLAGMSRVTEFVATRGTYSSMVKLKCSVKQVGTTTTYLDIQRRPLGSVDDDAWITLTTLSGTASTYSYDDVTALPGSYNEYRIVPWSLYNDKREENTAMSADGFSVSTGVVSGRVTYGTGTAVDGAKVVLKPNNAEGDTINVMRSLKFSGTGSGMTYNTTNRGVRQLFGKDFSVQVYVSPSLTEMSEGGKTYSLFDVAGLFGLTMKYDASKKEYLLGAKVGSNATTTTLAIPRGQWSHLTCVHNAANGITTFYVAEADTLRKIVALTDAKLTLSGNDKDAAKVNLAYLDDVTTPTFKGYVDEFRIFTKALTEKDILRNYNHPLAGSETALALYWPMDEGISGQAIAYDFSKTDNVGNGRHGLASHAAVSDTYIPSESQLSLMAYTNEQGTFEVRGVPFSGEGTSYTIIPQLGGHNFKPAYQSRFVNMSMLNHSAVDFEDVSSFPVSGKIFYSGTTYPVEGVNLYVDGTICSKEGEPITTDAEGNYTISVPIGDHYITVAKSGHEFVYNGRYPADPKKTGELHTFNRAITGLEFRDTTLVNFTGRVVGGSIEGNKPVGFGQSVNNIGVTEFVLTPVNENPYMNAKKDTGEEGTTVAYEPNSVIVDIPSATDRINSKAWRGATIDDCRKFFIRTDSLTGEFSALVPPLEYKVSDMNVVKSGLKVGESTTIDLTNPNIVLSDTLYNDDGSGDYELYEYNTILKQNYHSGASFTVTQQGREDGSFGIDSYELEDELGKVTVNDIYSVGADKKVTYKYGGPIFVKDDPYTFLIEGFEEYVNADNKEKSRVPLKGNLVTISNAVASNQSVYVEAGTVNGENVVAGQVADLKSNELQLNDEGKAVYKWKAGLPNIADPYWRTISIYYDIDGLSYGWSGNGMRAIVLGDLPTGNNFVTSGPDKLLMVLRDPPGTNSSATWTSGKVITRSEVKGSTFTENFTTKFNHKFGFKNAIIVGTPATGTITEAEATDDLTAGVKIESSGEDSRTNTYSTSITTEISTSDAPEYVGDQGDVFVGTATNIIFGKARNVKFQRNPNGGVKLGLEDIVTTGLKFGTTFSYTRNYIENVLFPNWEKMRQGLLTPAKSQAFINSYVNNSDKVVYLTTLSPDDENYGQAGTYKAFAPKNPKDGVVYEDSVKWITAQITNWQNYLKKNEEAKVKAFRAGNKYLKLNRSFDSGTSITYTVQNDTTSNHTWDWNCSAGVVAENTFGFKLGGVGFDCTIEDETMGGRHETEENDTVCTTAFSYTLAEEGDDDALSVDVYEYDQYGPIFRTRGGQTCNPYEGEVVTKYYEPGTTIMEATMQIEVPQIDVDEPIVSDIPTGGVANYTLRLSNASEIDEDVYYKLLIADETNPDGANLMIDGKPITDNRIIKIPAGQTITKALQLKQTNTGILDYDSVAVVLASQYQFDPTSTWDVITDTVWVSAHFVPSSSDVMLALSNTTMNTQTGTSLLLTFSNFDRNYNKQKAFRLQYKKQGATDWTLLKEYVLNAKDKTNNNVMLPTEGASVSYTLPMASYSDGNYLFRVVSAATYGTGEVYRYSNEVALVKDMMRPRPMGQPEPADGVLDIGEDLSVTFNENFLKGELTPEQNFKVTGVLNGAEIDHETALGLGSTEIVATTDADINLTKKDFSFDAWVNISGAGTLLSHGQGAQKMTVGMNAAGKLIVDIAGNAYTSDAVMPMGKWAFLTLSVSNADDATPTLNAKVVEAANETTLFLNRAVATYEGNGPLSVGKNLKGAIHELLLWDEAHDMTTALLNRSRTKAPSTRHLIGYWKMNEGEGKEIRDYARNRHMTMANETWYLNNENKAVNLDGQHYVDINAGQLNTFASDDSAIEFWMRGEKQTGEAQLLQMGDVALWTNAQGELQLTGKDAFKPVDQTTSYATASGNILDGAWHHIALNILRQGAAAVYVDGKRCLTTNGANVGTIATDKLLVGAKRTTFSASTGSYSYERAFKGQVDEIRVWNATLNADLLAQNRKVRLTGKEDGLVAYYPFEKKQLDSGNQIQTVGNDADLTGSGLKAKLFSTVNSQLSTVNYTDEAPALRTKPTETNVNFTFVASDNKVVINIDEDPAVIEGCTLNFTVRDLRDENGNYSEPAVWSAFVNRKELVWADDQLTATQQVKNGTTLTATVVNRGGLQQMWTLSGMPSWLTADAEYGTTNPRSETQVTFMVNPATPIGKYEETVYLKGNDGIEVPLTFNIKVTGQVPAWSVNPRDFEKSMNVIGRVEMEGVPMTDADDLVGAFIGEECRGVAHLEYKERYDGYFVTMDIYGNKDDEAKPVTFRVYDASTGTLYPAIEPDRTIKYESLALVGKYAAPVVFNVLDKIEQSTELKAGWNWISFNVKADDMKASSLFEKVADDVITVKSQNNGWLMYEEGEWGGSLTGNLANEQMYAVQMKSDRTLRIVGKRVNPADCQLTVKNGWNWIGYYGRQVASVSDALAGLQPKDGDILKGQSGVAYFDDYEWAGSLYMLEPGLGYMLNSTDKNARTFGYPSVTVAGAPRREAGDAPVSTVFVPVDFHTYSGNAIMAAKVMDGSKALAGAELGVFAGGECRAVAVTDERGVAYLTIPGDDAATLTFKVAVGDAQSDAFETLDYEKDASYGSPKHPFVINLSEPTRISGISADGDVQDIYDLQGRKMNSDTKRLTKGVYIINGKKTVVK